MKSEQGTEPRFDAMEGRGGFTKRAIRLRSSRSALLSASCRGTGAAVVGINPN